MICISHYCRRFWSNVNPLTRLALKKYYEWDLRMFGFSAEDYLREINVVPP